MAPSPWTLVTFVTASQLTECGRSDTVWLLRLGHKMQYSFTYFFLSLSFSPWVLLKVWYRRGDISIFKRKPFCDKCFLPGILKTWKLLWGPIEKILLVVLDEKKRKWHIEGDFYSFTMLSGRFCFNIFITFILVKKLIVSLWTRWMNCKINVKK